MANNQWVQAYEESFKKASITDFCIGDTVRVVTQIIEGEKERSQAFQGTVIARKGRGISETFSLYRVSFGIGIERLFYVHSPRLTEIQVIKRGAVRRAKLYYLRGKKGKAGKVQEKIEGRTAKVQQPEVQQNS